MMCSGCTLDVLLCLISFLEEITFYGWWQSHNQLYKF